MNFFLLYFYIFFSFEFFSTVFLYFFILYFFFYPIILSIFVSFIHSFFVLSIFLSFFLKFLLSLNLSFCLSHRLTSGLGVGSEYIDWISAEGLDSTNKCQILLELPSLPSLPGPLWSEIGWRPWIQRLHLCRGVTLPNKFSEYDIKRSDAEAPVMWSTPLLLPGPLWLWVVAPDRVSICGSNRTKLCTCIKLNYLK